MGHWWPTHFNWRYLFTHKTFSTRTFFINLGGFYLLMPIKKNQRCKHLKLGDSWNHMPPVLVPSSAKRIATQMLVIAKLNGREDFVLRGLVCDIIRPSKKLPVQNYLFKVSKLLKHKNKVWKLLRIKHEDNGVLPCLYC